MSFFYCSNLAQKNSAMTEDKIQEVVEQLGKVSEERDELSKSKRQFEIRVAVSLYFNSDAVG